MIALSSAFLTFCTVGVTVNFLPVRYNFSELCSHRPDSHSSAYSLAFSPDESKIAVSIFVKNENRTFLSVAIAETSTRKVIKKMMYEYSGSDSSIPSNSQLVYFDDKESRVFVSTNDKIYIASYSGRRKDSEIPLPKQLHRLRPCHIHYSLAQDRLTTVHHDKSSALLFAYDNRINKGDIANTISTNIITNVSIDESNSRIAISHEDDDDSCYIDIYDYSMFPCKKVFSKSLPQNTVTCSAFQQSTDAIAFGTAAGKVTILRNYSSNSSINTVEYAVSRRAVSSIGYLADNLLLFSTYEAAISSNVVLCNLKPGQIIFSNIAQANGIVVAKFSGSRKIIATIGVDGVVMIHKLLRDPAKALND